MKFTRDQHGKLVPVLETLSQNAGAVKPAGELAAGPSACRSFSPDQDRENTDTAPPLADRRAPATFHCPLWPVCGCPPGTMHPACPGLKARRGVNLDSAPPRTSNPTRDGMFGPRLFWLFLIAGVGTTAFVMMMFMIEALKG